MLKLLDRIADRVQLWGMRKNQNGFVDGVRLTSIRAEPSDAFARTIQASLALIHDIDPRRYTLITGYFSWVCDGWLRRSLPVKYFPSTRSCIVNFRPLPGFSDERMAALYACLLIQGATDAVTMRYKCRHTDKDAVWCARILTIEHNRFAERLASVDSEKYPLSLFRMVG